MYFYCRPQSAWNEEFVNIHTDSSDFFSYEAVLTEYIETAMQSHEIGVNI